MIYVTTRVIPDLLKVTYLRFDLACALMASSSNSGVNVYFDWILMFIWYETEGIHTGLVAVDWKRVYCLYWMDRWMDLSIYTVTRAVLSVSRESGCVIHLMQASSLLPHTPCLFLRVTHLIWGVIKRFQHVSMYSRNIFQRPCSRA